LLKASSGSCDFIDVCVRVFYAIQFLKAFAHERRVAVESLAAAYPHLVKLVPSEKVKGWRQHEFITPVPQTQMVPRRDDVTPEQSKPSPHLCEIKPYSCANCLELQTKLREQEYLVSMLLAKQTSAGPLAKQTSDGPLTKRLFG
jgi:hypothetical protein